MKKQLKKRVKSIKRSKALKKLYKDPVYKEKVRQAIIAGKHTDEARLNASKASTAMWLRPGYKEMMIEKHKKRYRDDPTLRTRIGESSSKSWEDADRHDKGREAARAWSNSTEGKQLHKELVNRRKERLADPIEGPKLLSKMIAGGKKTIGENNIHFLIRLMGLPYEYTGKGQKMIGTFCPDFCRTEGKAIIEIFGWFHRQEANKIRDKRKFEVYKEQGYDFLVIDTDELRDVVKVCNKIWKFEKSVVSKLNSNHTRTP